MTPETEVLEPWFAAARAEREDAPLALLSAILADAGAVSGGRMSGAGTMTKVHRHRRKALPAAPRQVGTARPLDRLGGWKGLAALAACAALGLWVGMDGRVTIEDGTVWKGARAVAADSAPDDPVGAFFDLASAEG